MSILLYLVINSFLLSQLRLNMKSIINSAASLSLAFITCILLNYSAYAQQGPSTEKELKEYILKNLDEEETIVGIYVIGGRIDKYMGGELKQNQTVPYENRVAIVRKGSCLVTVAIPSNEFTNACDFVPTTSPNIFLMNGEEMTLNSDGSLTTSMDLSKEQIAKALDASVKDVVKLDIRFVAHMRWRKIFPTKADIVNFTK